MLVAVNAISGLEQFNSHPEIQFVFSDVIMPGGMNGIEMAEKMLMLRPDILILLATGYAEKSSKERILQNTHVQIVAKPYDTDLLPMLIGNMLRQQS